MVGLEPQFFVGFDRIQPVVLEGIGLQLCHQANSPPFLLLVKENSSTRFRYEAERHFELLPAIAAQRAEHVSGEALGVDAHQRRRTVDIAQDQRYSLFGASSLEIAHKPMNAEMRPARRKIRLCKLSNRKRGRQLFSRRSFSRHSFIIATRTAPTPAAVSQFPFKGGCRRNGSRLELGGISGIIGDARAGNMTPKGLIAIGLVWFVAVVLWLRFFDKGLSYVWMAPSPAKQAALIAGLYFLMLALLIFLAGWLVPLGFGVYRLIRHH